MSATVQIRCVGGKLSVSAALLLDFGDHAHIVDISALHIFQICELRTGRKSRRRGAAVDDIWRNRPFGRTPEPLIGWRS
jgi:hypothetical protein